MYCYEIIQIIVVVRLGLVGLKSHCLSGGKRLRLRVYIKPSRIICTIVLYYFERVVVAIDGFSSFCNIDHERASKPEAAAAYDFSLFATSGQS